MKKSLGMAFLVLAVMHCGASAPRQTDAGDAAGDSKKSVSDKGSVSPQGFAADQILKFFGSKAGKNAAAGRKNKNVAGVSVSSSGAEVASEMFRLPPKPMNAPVSGFAKVPGLADAKALRVTQDAKAAKDSVASTGSEGAKVKKIKRLVSPPPPVPRMVVPQIRQEVQKILDLNKQIKSVQAGRAGEFRRVQEQAQLHQKILNDLENAKQDVKDRKIPQREDLLAQEKLRIIHEETQRNMALLEAAGSARAVTSVQGSAGSGVQSVAESELKPKNS